MAEPPDVMGKRKFYANEGYNAVIKCVSKGSPDPRFTWTWLDKANHTKKLQDGEEDERFRVVTRHSNTSSESVLSIQRITRADWQVYTCSAANKWGRDSAVMKLTGFSEYELSFFV